MKIAICDDDKLVRNDIWQRLLKLFPESSIDTYQSGEELLESDVTYDLVFLDIEMSGMSGMQTAEILRRRKKGSLIIFLTSYSEWMPDAFKVRAFRFLTKPIQNNELVEAVTEAREEITAHVKILVQTKGQMVLMDQQDIVCCEAFGDGTYIYTKQEVLESSKPLKYWKETLGTEHFYQVHKSYIVSLRHVKIVHDKEIQMNYMNTSIPVSRRKHMKFKEIFFEYVKKNARHI